MLLATVAGFVVGVIVRGGWPALPPADTFWWAAWAAPFGAVAFALVPPQAPSRSPWPQGLVALPLGHALGVQASVALGLLATLWGVALLGASVAAWGTPRRGAFGAGPTGLLVLLGLVLAAWRYAGLPVGAVLLLAASLALVACPLPRRLEGPSVVLAVAIAGGVAWWAHRTSPLLELYAGG